MLTEPQNVAADGQGQEQPWRHNNIISSCGHVPPHRPESTPGWRTKHVSKDQTRASTFWRMNGVPKERRRRRRRACCTGRNVRLPLPKIHGPAEAPGLCRWALGLLCACPFLLASGVLVRPPRQLGLNPITDEERLVWECSPHCLWTAALFLVLP